MAALGSGKRMGELPGRYFGAFFRRQLAGLADAPTVNCNRCYSGPDRTIAMIAERHERRRLPSRV